MKETLRKCIISKYDETITEPPFLTIPLDEVEVMEPKKGDLGVEFSNRMKKACREKGYVFKFYTMSKKEGFDFEIVVYNDTNDKNIEKGELFNLDVFFIEGIKKKIILTQKLSFDAYTNLNIGQETLAKEFLENSKTIFDELLKEVDILMSLIKK